MAWNPVRCHTHRQRMRVSCNLIFMSPMKANFSHHSHRPCSCIALLYHALVQYWASFPYYYYNSILLLFVLRLDFRICSDYLLQGYVTHKLHLGRSIGTKKTSFWFCQDAHRPLSSLIFSMRIRNRVAFLPIWVRGCSSPVISSRKFLWYRAGQQRESSYDSTDWLTDHPSVMTSKSFLVFSPSFEARISSSK